ncbi:hypothetical protein TEPIDINF_002416 [Tepidibacillus infernus]|uniref:hypothetical protein n=1 Tax=Tepidibacillus infernus TaxID=1806172 RepID=UPI003B7296B7
MVGYEDKKWEAKEDDFIINYVKENEINKNKIIIFEELATKINCTPREVAKRYFDLVRGKSISEEQIENFIRNLQLDDTRLKNFINVMEKLDKIR